MLLSHFKRLCISLVFIISASPLEAAPTLASTPSALPEALQSAVPSCALSCIRASLDERFPVVCSGQEGIQCLCSRFSNVGETLGEVALGCIYLSCPKGDSQEFARSAYGVCLGQKDAVMPTKTALTYVVTGAPRTITPSTTPTATDASTITSTSQSQISSTQSALVDSISTLPSATSFASTTPAAAAMAEEAPPKMTPAQIAGLSVAAVAAFIMAIGLMALSVCLRRRRERRGSFDSDEKGQRQKSARFSHYVLMEDRPEPPSRFPMMPPTAARKNRNPNTHPRTVRPAQRLGVGTANSSSDSSLPLSQIGLAISAELDSKPIVPKKASEAVAQQQTPAKKPSQLSLPFRPVSTMTQDTVFEEDELPARRRSSMLLPTPPVPIPPIRALQPSRTMPTYTTTRPKGPAGRRSELFLDIPVRHQKPPPTRIIAAQMASNGSPQPPRPSSRPRLAPPFQMTSTATSYESKATTASSRDASNDGDIIDYYFSRSLSQESTPKGSPAQIARPKESAKTTQMKAKKSRSSTLSRVTSRTSTNIRDSGSSQTSFETVSPNDPTPEDEDEDKQLSSSSSDEATHLSPVAESPISKLRYPKVPRASNQLVPRSPKSPPHRNNSRSHRGGPVNPSTLLQKRNNALPPLLLESRPRLESPLRDPFVSPPRPLPSQTRARSHKRSNSTESWSTTPASKVDRKSRVQSGVWHKSPVMYEEDVVRPLNVRRKRDEMAEINIGRDVDVDAEGLKSPVWVPRLTPRRKGEDLFLEVEGGRWS